MCKIWFVVHLLFSIVYVQQQHLKQNKVVEVKQVINWRV